MKINFYLRMQPIIMAPAATQAEHRHRIANVIDHLFKHSSQDVPSEELAAIAH
jgi:hypothetical protein